QIKSIAPDGKPAAKNVWDCPICQLQLGSDTPKPLGFTLSLNTGEKIKIAPPVDDLLLGEHYLRPHQPRAPPKA
ncbi:MAG: hypothetical protein OEW37_05890, partial [Rhodospirillaceae bacterium]|nr:hypothetical protein [Rhodospirillaceae bacterium]